MAAPASVVEFVYSRPVPTKPDAVDAAMIAKVASASGLSLDPAALHGLEEFARLFLTWNERINLGGAITGPELVNRHFVDSFWASRFVAAGSHVMDAGSGGGLPAIPLAVVRPDLRVHLFEPTGKKVAFLRAAVRDLALKGRVDVHPERVTPGSGATLERVDVAMSRATWGPAEWLALGRCVARPGGTVLVFGTGGPGDPDEAPRAEYRYAADRRLLIYDQAPITRST
jgi:16S rRNA (guanine527-N7)-methyltransferase